MKSLKSLLKDDRKLYITGFDYEITPCILDVDESLLNGWVGDYFCARPYDSKERYLCCADRSF